MQKMEDPEKRDIAAIRRRMVAFLQDGRLGALYNGADSSDLNWLAPDLLKNGPCPGTKIWKDIDYENQSPSAWHSARHLDRIRAVLIADGQAWSEDKQQRNVLLSLLDYWLQADPKSGNWFYNQIGIPKNLGAIALLLGDKLPPSMRHKLLEIVSRGSLAHPPLPNVAYPCHRNPPELWTGANLLWGATVSFYHALLTENAELLARTATWVQTALDYGTEGIQPDGGFRQHGPRWYSGGYGRSFVGELVPFFLCLQQTPWALSRDSEKKLCYLLLEGQRKMQHGGCFDYGAVGREMVRPGKLSAFEIAVAAEYLAQVPGMPGAELSQLAAEIRGDRSQSFDPTYYPSIALLTVRKHGCYLSVRGSRPDLYGAEKTNGEGVLCYHMSYGTMTCCMATGQEYFDLAPAWDYASIPGTTAAWEPDKALLNRGDWHITFRQDNRCYARTEGDCAVMYQKTSHDGILVHASYFIYDGCLICLGVGEAEETGAGLFTTVEQCRADSSAWIEKGVEAINGGFRYRNLEPDSQFLLKEETVSGSWYRNDLSAPETPVTVRRFTLSVAQEKKIHYAYMICPCDVSHRVQVLHNAEGCQAIRINDKHLLAVTWQGYALSEENGVILASQHPDRE